MRTHLKIKMFSRYERASVTGNKRVETKNVIGGYNNQTWLLFFFVRLLYNACVCVFYSSEFITWPTTFLILKTPYQYIQNGDSWGGKKKFRAKRKMKKDQFSRVGEERRKRTGKRGCRRKILWINNEKWPAQKTLYCPAPGSIGSRPWDYVDSGILQGKKGCALRFI